MPKNCFELEFFLDGGTQWAIKLGTFHFHALSKGLGADRVMAEAAEMGHSEFILCSIIYKGYRLVMPRHPRQIYQLETGMTFYPADESAYADGLIRPVSTHDWAGRDLFQRGRRGRRQSDYRPVRMGLLFCQRARSH